MLYIATTRFNDATWQQNNSWRERHEWAGCIYGSPTLIKDTIPIGMNVAILEMHNDLNTIMGIGIISNNIEKEKNKDLVDNGIAAVRVYTDSKEGVKIQFLNIQIKRSIMNNLFKTFTTKIPLKNVCKFI